MPGLQISSRTVRSIVLCVFETGGRGIGGMAKRYGRNQRRAHRETIKVLTEKAGHLQAYGDREKALRHRAEHRAAEAKGEALRQFMDQSDYVKACLDLISEELGRCLGERLRQPAEQILQGRRHEPAVHFDATMHTEMSGHVTVIRGEIPRLNYAVRMCGLVLR